MSIRRGKRPSSNFYQLDKRISEDQRLSWGARGLLIFLLGKPDHWNVSIAALVGETAGSGKATGRDGVYSLLQELIDAGYVTREQGKAQGGHFGSMDYVVSELPLPPAPLTDEPYTDEPYTANPTLVKTETSAKTEDIAKTENLLGDATKSAADQEFEAAWSAYPKRLGGNSKALALKSWAARRRAGVPVETMIDGVKRYAFFCKSTGKVNTEYVKQASSFFGPAEHYLEPWAAKAVDERGRASYNRAEDNASAAESQRRAGIDLNNIDPNDPIDF